MARRNIIQIIIIDFLSGFYGALYGLWFLIRLNEEDSKDPIIIPPKKQAKTVMEMRREREMGVVRRPVEAPKKKASVLRRLTQIYTLNIVFLVLWQLTVWILTFSFSRIHRPYWGQTLGDALLIPLFFGTKLIHALWFSDIAGACMRALKKTPPVQASPLKMLEESIKSIIHQTLFLLQCCLANHLPIPLISPIIGFIHLAFLNSMYCFDYFFDNFNIFSCRRRHYFDSHWPFFIGFGTPLALACSITNDTFLKAVIFSFLFPLFIISSYTANWNQNYEEKIPKVEFCRVASMFTKLVLDGFKKLTTVDSDEQQKIHKLSK